MLLLYDWLRHRTFIIYVAINSKLFYINYMVFLLTVRNKRIIQLSSFDFHITCKI